MYLIACLKFHICALNFRALSISGDLLHLKIKSCKVDIKTNSINCLKISYFDRELQLAWGSFTRYQQSYNPVTVRVFNIVSKMISRNVRV